MTTLIITMYIRPGKNQELLLTLNELEPLNRQTPGYIKTVIHSPPDDEHCLMVVQEWQTWQDVEQYMQSYTWGGLRGAFRVLATSARIELKQTAQIFETCVAYENS